MKLRAIFRDINNTNLHTLGSDDFFVERIEKEINARGSCVFSVMNNTKGTNTTNPIFSTDALCPFNKVDIYEEVSIGDYKWLFSGFVGGIRPGQTVTQIRLLSFYDFCVKKPNRNEISSTATPSPTVSFLVNSFWGGVMALQEENITFSVNDEPIEYNYPTGTYFSQVLDDIVKNGQEIYYRESKFAIMNEIGATDKDDLIFDFKHPNQANCYPVQEVDYNFAQSANWAIAINGVNASVASDIKTGSHLIGKSINTNLDVEKAAIGELESSLSSISEFPIEIKQGAFPIYEFNPGDFVNVSVDNCFDLLSIEKSLLRVQKVTHRFGSSGLVTTLELSKKPKNELTTLDLYKRLKSLELSQ